MIKVVKRNTNSKHEVNTLKDIVLSFRKSIFFIGFISFITNILMLLPSIYMLAVYDIVVPSRSVPTLLMITFLVIGLYFILGAFQIIRTKVAQIIGIKLDNTINQYIVKATLKYALKNPSKASAQPINDLHQIRQFLTSQVLFAIFDVPWVPIYLIVLFIFHTLYGVMAIFAMVTVILITVLNEFLTRKELKMATEQLIKSNTFFNHVLQNAEIVEALGMRKNIYKKWKNFYIKHLISFQKASNINNVLSNITKILRIMFQSLMLGLGAYLAINQEISMGMIIAGTILLGRVMSPIDILIGGWRNVTSARLAYNRLSQLLKESSDKPKSVQLPPPKGEITLHQVTVIPPEGENPVIKGISLRILPGEFVAIIGPSGSGKSSLIRTILGIWKPVVGKVEIDGADLEQWDREYLGQFIGYLPQDIELFEGTIAENIARFSDVDSEKVLEAATLSGAHEVIVKLPQGYDTYIGPGGIKLSGGQRQRIALARALYGNPRIVILDEPDSNLDERGEVALYNALVELKKRGATVIVISHKLRILNLADKIALIQDGTLKMYGKADIVLQKLMEARRSG